MMSTGPWVPGLDFDLHDLDLLILGGWKKKNTTCPSGGDFFVIYNGLQWYKVKKNHLKQIQDDYGQKSICKNIDCEFHVCHDQTG